MALEQLILYRGDASKIKEFDYNKTNKYCLFGQGIYLTDKLALAESYRGKGEWNALARVTRLTSVPDADRTKAYEKAFEDFFLKIYTEHLHPTPLTWPEIKKNRKKLEALARPIYQNLVAEGRIKGEYGTYTTSTHDIKTGRIRRTSTKCVHVDYHHVGQVTGYITEFSFDKKQFLDTMINIDSFIDDEYFWHIAEENELEIMKHYRDGSGLWGRKGGQIPHDRLNFKQIEKVYSKYGYRGFKYKGGQYTGGMGLHNAFVVWDDDFVNEHIVKRYR